MATTSIQKSVWEGKPDNREGRVTTACTAHASRGGEAEHRSASGVG